MTTKKIIKMKMVTLAAKKILLQKKSTNSGGLKMLAGGPKTLVYGLKMLGQGPRVCIRRNMLGGGPKWEGRGKNARYGSKNGCKRLKNARKTKKAQWGSKSSLEGSKSTIGGYEKAPSKYILTHYESESSIPEWVHHLSNKRRNKLVKSYNGNGKLRHSVSVVHWNAGNRHWRRKTEEIESLILEKDPDLLFVSEANLMVETPDFQRKINGYNMVLPPTLQSLKYARIVLLVREGIQYKVLDEYMANDLANIWVKIGQRGRKPQIVGGIYREHHLLQPGAPRGTQNLTGTPQQQLDRWRRTVLSWKSVSKDAKCTVVGDLNLDYVNWLDPRAGQVEMVNLVKNELENRGFFQLITTITRTWPQQEDSLVDHIWSNSVDRVISHSNDIRASSDHNVISIRLRMKDRVIRVQEVQKRMRKELDQKKLVEDIKKVDWTELLQSKSIDVINGILESEIRKVLDIQAPIKNSTSKDWIQKLGD